MLQHLTVLIKIGMSPINAAAKRSDKSPGNGHSLGLLAAQSLAAPGFKRIERTEVEILS
jgi:hypothetical protein